MTKVNLDIVIFVIFYVLFSLQFLIIVIVSW